MSANRSSAHSDSLVRDDILAIVPQLRGFAISLSGNVDRADDLVQETLLRALANIDSFELGTNLPAWLFTILRNAFRTEYRKRRREVEDSNGRHAEMLKTYPEQHGHIDFKELQQALGKLPASQREALILVCASGFSYKEAAKICGCADGTVKSRVHRARITLAELLSIEDIDDLGSDQASRAVVAGTVGMSAEHRPIDYT
jgi:RNA polymerase sigma-70 factor (ECF subfamily)